MSCQQASRFIAANNNCSNISSAITNTTTSSSSTNNNSSSISNNLHNNINNITTRIVTTEDPYVFTESVPTTPPVLFNTQKSRPRLNDIIAGGGGTSISFANVQPQQQKLTTTQTNGKLAAIKTQASLVTTTTAAATTTPTLKNVTTQSLATSAAATQNKKVTNVCIVRPQLQQQQQQHVITSCLSLEGELKSISPPPLYTPTPSLWQTPLLIETPQATTHAPPLPTTLPLTPSSPTSQGGNVAGQSIGSTSLSMSTTTTAMAKVAPIVVHTPSPPSQTSPSPPLASCLPPSKFHNHTLAQHLQKVECLKKPKKSVQPMAAPLPPTPPTQFCEDLKGKAMPTSCVEPEDCGKVNAVKHSGTEELNEIPVNVIFRMALVPQHQQQNDNKSKKQNKTKFVAPPANTTILSSSSQTKTNVNRKVTATTSTPASRLNNQVQQINTSSMQPQQQQPTSKLPAIKQQNGDSDANENSEPLALARSIDEKPLAKSKASNTKSTSNNTRKSTASKSVSSASSNARDYANDPFTVGCSTSKGAVAIVKLSRHRDEDASSVDYSHLATASGLPYCLQNYWFNSCDIRKPLIVADKVKNRSSMREERITSYKQQLRRQAMQLLSTRSLQKLPLHVARRRLVCVDRLLRKYYKQNEKSLPANVKRCCANGCDAYTLEMASHCQQHIVLSAGKEIFLPCTAKFADNTQCRVPVFDITHDLPLCLEHERKRDAYNRLLYEQKPRKTAASNAASIFVSEAVGGATAKQHKAPVGNRRATAEAPTRKRKAGTGNPVGRPQKRAKKSQEQPAVVSVITTTTVNQMPRLPTTGLKRKGSTTSLESIASNSQHSTTSSTSQLQHHQQFYTMTTSFSPASAQGAGLKTLPPPALAPLSTGFMGNNCLPQHLFSFGHDNVVGQVNKHSSAISPTTEFKDFISNLTFPPHKAPSSTSSSSYPTIESTDANFINTNSNSNFTSSGMGSTTSLPTADDFLTQDMLSICENSSASSVDTGLGGLSDPELMLGGPDGDDMPLGDTHLLEEHDLANVLNSLPEDAFKELFATVHQHESDEIERAIELADKHLKTLQQTIGSELGDFLDFNDDMLMDNSDMCNPAAVTTTNGILDTTALFVGATAAAVGGGNVGATGSADTRGLVQT